MSNSPINEELAATLREAATRAARLAGGGCALLFAKEPGEQIPRLRAAAGFPSADAAREAARGAVPVVQEAVAKQAPHRANAIPMVGERGQHGTWSLPLQFRGRLQGVLLVCEPGPIAAEAAEDIRGLAEQTSMVLDHAVLTQENQWLRESGAKGAEGEAPSDELLKLSEALFAQDIELLRSHEKLGKIEKLKNDFIEKMSRELRTPLNSIIEAIISVLAGENDRLSDSAKDCLRVALDEGTAFQRTLQNILDLWRIKQGELPVEIQEVNFAEVVEEAIFSVQQSVDETAVSIEKRLELPMPKFKADLAKTNQILFLLLENAAKFTREGSITIRARVTSEHLECEVVDTGIGICPDDQQFIFDEFYQVDELSSTRYTGAGLGLTLVQDLLVLLGGEILVSSEPGVGTRMTFRIPVELS